MVFVQIPLPVRVLIQRAQCESRFELAADPVSYTHLTLPTIA